jgi:C_GCAxxG_C_C family probable redox protein
MTRDLAEEAEKLMLENRNYNCSQAIFATYGEQLGIDYDTCLKIASAFGGGLAGTGYICGALTGASMVLGLKHRGIKGEDPLKINKATQKLFDEFESLNGSIICRELISHDLLTDENVQQAFKMSAFKNCPKFVKDSAQILEKLL